MQEKVSATCVVVGLLRSAFLSAVAGVTLRTPQKSYCSSIRTYRFVYVVAKLQSNRRLTACAP